MLQVQDIVNEELDEASEFERHKDFHKGLKPQEPHWWEEDAANIHSEPLQPMDEEPAEGGVAIGSCASQTTT